MTQVAAVDPVTFEVMMHRLWAINDEQALITARISGSPVVYEANDFNAAILTADGGGLFIGMYVTSLAASLDMVVHAVLARFEPDEIRPGDAFLTNDPWAGALHQNDFVLVTPLFADGEIVCWTGITMHEVDVGGPVPGSIAVGARDVFGEGPLIPPLKLIEAGRVRKDLLDLVVRNSRTSELNALNLRARIASQHICHERLGAMLERYGKQTFLAVQRRIVDVVAERFRSRLLELPDGTWTDRVYIDHDGHDDTLYELHLRAVKEGGRLTLDFRGTSPQAPGIINCTRSGLMGGVMNSIFPLLFYDLPWSTAALHRCVEVVADEGTLNNARYPAAVSMATLSAGHATGTLINAVLARMMACSDPLREEMQAPWYPSWNGLVMSGRDRDRRRFTTMVMNSGAGGGGARSDRDGIDTGGMRTAVGIASPNVDANERLYPILEVYRRQCPGTGGHGRYRGGLGMEYMLVPHKSPEPIHAFVFCHGASQPGAAGVLGGHPSSTHVNLVLRESGVGESFAAGHIPRTRDEVSARSVEVLPAKAATRIADGDALVMRLAGGGGYGDPIRRDPEAVRRDVRRGLCTPGDAAAVYGVVADPDGGVDATRTEALRREMRAERLKRCARRVEVAHLTGEAVRRIGEAAEVVSAPGGARVRCAGCHTDLGAATQDFKLNAVYEEVPLGGLNPLNREGPATELCARLFYCPGCGAQIAVTVDPRGTPPPVEMELSDAGVAGPERTSAGTPDGKRRVQEADRR